MKPAGPYDTRPLYWCGNEPIDAKALLDGIRTEEARIKTERDIAALEMQQEAQRQNMSGPRELRLPPLLEKRRLEWNIPDQEFYYVASYDWVGVYQIPPITGQIDRAGTGRIIKPDQTKAIELATAARGIIITAGLAAMDYLESHGHQIGAIVRFVRLAPYRQEVGKIGNRDFELVTIKPGDICSNEDHFPLIQSGRMKLVREKDADGRPHYIYKLVDGGTFNGDMVPPSVGDY